MTTVYIGLGGNLGDPEQRMGDALRRLDRNAAIQTEAVSAIYRTPPWGRLDQPDFLNACARLATRLDAPALLRVCLDVEEELHRQRSERWGPRTIDIDLLLFGSERIETPGLVVPHPRMLERAFVLRPLADIAPDIVLEGRSVAEHLARADQGGIAVHRDGGEWWRAAEGV